MKKTKEIILATVAILMLALVSAAVILYAKGAFDISFIDRGKKDEVQDRTVYDTLAPDETGPAPDYEDIGEMGEPETVSAASLTFPSQEELTASGSKADTGIFSSDRNVLSAAEFKTEIPNVFSYRDKWTEINVRKDGENGGYTGAREKVLESRKTIELYAGYVFYDCGGTMYLLSADGEPLIRFADGDIEPAYCYNKDGQPLFLHGDRYCHYDDELKCMIEEDITYVHEVDSIGLYFDHAPSYGRGTGETRYRNSRWMWSFINSTNPDVYKYYGLYYFSESLAAAIEAKVREIVTEGVEVDMTQADGSPETDSEGNVRKGTAKVATYEKIYELNYLDTAGRTALTGDRRFTDENGNQVVASWQMPLFTHGKEAMGYLYFENGLCRVREVTMDLYSKERKIYSDRDYIIRSDGTHFPIPDGYEVISYSNGMILLGKDGRYGFMNSEGEWKVQPVFSYAEPYFEGLAVIGMDNGKKALVDTNGDYVIPFAYSYISNVSGGYVSLYDDETGWQILCKMTKPVQTGKED
ncbi:MAG: WG repeat-containing protein [Clostridia bacterium]|nr:WG repeat-containing protein [Clostridia bacterium]